MAYNQNAPRIVVPEGTYNAEYKGINRRVAKPGTSKAGQEYLEITVCIRGQNNSVYRSARIYDQSEWASVINSIDPMLLVNGGTIPIVVKHYKQQDGSVHDAVYYNVPKEHQQTKRFQPQQQQTQASQGFQPIETQTTVTSQTVGGQAGQAMPNQADDIPF